MGRLIMAVLMLAAAGLLLVRVWNHTEAEAKGAEMRAAQAARADQAARIKAEVALPQRVPDAPSVVNKCTDAQGSVTLSNQPCPKGSETALQHLHQTTVVVMHRRMDQQVAVALANDLRTQGQPVPADLVSRQVDYKALQDEVIRYC